jgi:hypothetical protein
MLHNLVKAIAGINFPNLVNPPIRSNVIINGAQIKPPHNASIHLSNLRPTLFHNKKVITVG